MAYDLKISIIIPVYSVANYLPQCIESVLNQSYQNTEIILIDDGSPDTSPSICNQYASLYSNIKVVHKKNGGASDARNTGISCATGDYITFLDGDDFWDDTDALTRLVARLSITHPDVLNFSFKKYYIANNVKVPYFENIPPMPLEYIAKKAQLDYLAEHHLYIASACSKLVKKELFTEQLLFEEGASSEDLLWSAQLLKIAKSMDFICENFYCYRQHQKSTSHTIDDKKCQDLCRHIIDCISLATTATYDEKRALASYAAFQFGSFFIVQAQADNFQNECIAKLNVYHSILENHLRHKKLRLLNIGCKTIGFKKICILIRFAYQLKSVLSQRNRK